MRNEVVCSTLKTSLLVLENNILSTSFFVVIENLEYLPYKIPWTFNLPLLILLQLFENVSIL